MESAIYKTASSELEVIETFGFTPTDGFARLGAHIDRAEATCAKLMFPFDRAKVLQAIGEAVADVPARVRMTVDGRGQVSVTAAELAPTPDIWRVAIAVDRLQSDDPWLAVKTTQRALYDRTRAALPAHVDEVLFMNERGELCEGTITNVFVANGDELLTPPLSCGVLPGVLRAEVLQSGRASEAVITPNDLAAGFYMGNSLRGLIRAELV